MSFQKYLTEELESPNMRMGRCNVWFDRAKGGFEIYFKVGGTTYSCIAESEGTEYDDGAWKLQLRKKWLGNTETIEETKEVENAFVEALSEWVELKNPTKFYWRASEKYPAYNNIAKALAKKIKDYNFIDESAITEDRDKNYDVSNDEGEEKIYNRFIFTREELKEDQTSMEMAYTKLNDNEETFDVYEKPEDIKTNPDHMTYQKSDKLDKEGGY